MRARKYLVIVPFLIMLILFGCTEYHYTQTVEENGDSTLKLTMDYASTLEKEAEVEGKTIDKKLSEFKEEKEKKCEEITSENHEISCTVEGTTIELSKNFESGTYYEFTKKEEIPDNVYTLKISKIPNLELVDDFLSAEDVELSNITDEDEIKLFAATEIGLVLKYTVIMPGKVSEAYCGTLQGEIEGNSATFDLLEVGKQKSPIIVQSKEVEDFYINLVIGLVILIFLALMYLIFIRRQYKE